MTDLEQRAHDLALGLTIQFVSKTWDMHIKQSDSNEITLNNESDKISEVYCRFYDSFCKELTKRLD